MRGGDKVFFPCLYRRVLHENIASFLTNRGGLRAKSKNIQTHNYALASYLQRALRRQGSSQPLAQLWEALGIGNANSYLLFRAQGYFRVNGHATFTACDIQKISDGVPGLGGAIYNGASGSIMFEGGVTMQDMFINVRFNTQLSSSVS